jgi:hypothetical protein
MIWGMDTETTQRIQRIQERIAVLERQAELAKRHGTRDRRQITDELRRQRKLLALDQEDAR